MQLEIGHEVIGVVGLQLAEQKEGVQGDAGGGKNVDVELSEQGGAHGKQHQQIGDQGITGTTGVVHDHHEKDHVHDQMAEEFTLRYHQLSAQSPIAEKDRDQDDSNRDANQRQWYEQWREGIEDQGTDNTEDGDQQAQQQ